MDAEPFAPLPQKPAQQQAPPQMNVAPPLQVHRNISAAAKQAIRQLADLEYRNLQFGNARVFCNH